jgi:hypothetical protein
VDLEKKFMNEKQIRMMNAASTSDKANVLPVVIPPLGTTSSDIHSPCHRSLHC